MKRNTSKSLTFYVKNNVKHAGSLILGYDGIVTYAVLPTWWPVNQTQANHVANLCGSANPSEKYSSKFGPGWKFLISN